MDKTLSTILFEKPGRQNTEKTLCCALEAAKKEGITHLVLASSGGFTGLKAIELARKMRYRGKIVVVGYHCGFEKPGKLVMPQKNIDRLRSMGADVFFGAHALSGIARSFRQKFDGISIPEVIAETLRRFSQGVKVGIEVSIMAADAGLAPADRLIIGIGGSGTGADSAVMLRACNQSTFFDLKIRHILCMPDVRTIK